MADVQLQSCGGPNARDDGEAAAPDGVRDRVNDSDAGLAADVGLLSIRENDVLPRDMPCLNPSAPPSSSASSSRRQPPGAADDGRPAEDLQRIDGVRYVCYRNEQQMKDIMRLIQKDLSEPYSIYTYRYFIHNWPKLCFLVSPAAAAARTFRVPSAGGCLVADRV